MRSNWVLSESNIYEWEKIKDRFHNNKNQCIYRELTNWMIDIDFKKQNNKKIRIIKNKLFINRLKYRIYKVIKNNKN